MNLIKVNNGPNDHYNYHLESENGDTIIISNGSKWMGEEPDGIEELIEVLSKYPLDRTFEEYGCFFHRVNREDWVNPTEFADKWTGAMTFFGNFLTLSHVFDIYTFNQDLIERLIEAIENNRQRKDYLEQPVPKKYKEFFKME